MCIELTLSNVGLAYLQCPQSNRIADIFFALNPIVFLVSVFADSLENGKFHGFSGKKGIS